MSRNSLDEPYEEREPHRQPNRPINVSSLASRSVDPSKHRTSSFNFPDIIDDSSSSTSHILKQSVISNFQHDKFSIMTKAPVSHILFYEALASFVFLFGCSCINEGQEGEISILYVIFLLFAICLSGSLTGANINPSVTLSNVLRKENRYFFRMLPIYFAAQFIGSCIALIAAKEINGTMVKSITPVDTGDWKCILREGSNEMMGTIILVFFMLQITNPNTTFIENEISGFLSIVVLFFLALVMSPQTSSFAINFAIVAAINLSATVFHSDYDGWYWIWVYFLGELFGVIVAVFFYDKFFEPVIQSLREAKRDTFNFSQFTNEQEEDEEQDQEDIRNSQ